MRWPVIVRRTVLTMCVIGVILSAVANGQATFPVSGTVGRPWSEPNPVALPANQPAGHAAAPLRSESPIPGRQSVDWQATDAKRLPPVVRYGNNDVIDRLAAVATQQTKLASHVSSPPDETAADTSVMAIAQVTELPAPPTPGAAGGTASNPAAQPETRPTNGPEPDPLLGPQPPPPPEPGVRAAGPLEILDQAEDLSVLLRRSKLLRSAVDITRTAVVDSTICDVVQFSPREVSIIGKAQGATHVTFWFQDPTVLPRTFLVRVAPDPEVKQRREETFAKFEEIIAKLFPNSKVRLIPVGDKLLVTGQARDAAEAAQIMVLIRGEAVDQQGRWAWGRIVEGTTTGAVTPDETGHQLPTSQVINMLRIPGAHQVALRVKIAELNRTAARGFGVDLNMMMQWADGAIILQSLLNVSQGRSILGTFDQGRLNFGIRYLEQYGVLRMLSEPTLVTLSGRPASFVAGGEFAVPTIVGVQGASGITTDFRAFGAIITFLPTVIDKDHIRLEVSPEFSKINPSLSSGGTPGLDTRAVTTTVEMREGQTLAIAGLLDESMKNDSKGDLPLVAQIFGARNASREETELLILVTPELVHPMDPEEVPPLPGFDVTEPNNTQFFLQGWIEGRPTEEYRSTVWPRLRDRYNSCGSAMISGPYGHGNCGN